MKSFFYTLFITAIVSLSFLPAFAQCPTNASDTSGGAGVDYIFTVTDCTDLMAGTMFTSDGGATFISNDCTVPILNITLVGGVPDPLGFTIDFGGSIGSCTYSITGALPVDFVYFKAKKQNESVLLDWTTAMEINNSGFDVQHSMDGQNWVGIGFITGKGTSQDINEYQFIHAKPSRGTNYYRLKQIDLDGAFEYSDIETIQFRNGQNTPIQIFPNPVKDGLLTVQLEGELETEMLLQVFDLTGKRVLQQSSFEKDNQLDVSNLSSGIFMVEIVANGQITREKVVIE